MNTPNPRLRPLDFQPVYHQGERMWLLRDPLQLSPRQLIFPQALAQLLLFCDGAHTPGEILDAVALQTGIALPLDVVVDALAQLDDACLLDNARSQTAKAAALDAYRSQPYRPPALAGLSYPDDPAELDALFDRYAAMAPAATAAPAGSLRAIVSPHIDYQRGGSVYAQVWRQAAPRLDTFDLVLILGTDHNGSSGSITLTQLPYATPYGVLPGAPELVQQLATALGPEAAYAEELNHRHEHSIELSAVWLHHHYHRAGRSPVPMLPVLIGGFHHFLANGHVPATDRSVGIFIETLRRATAGKRVLVVASVDLAHVGPQFGDAFAMDSGRRAALRRDDQALIRRVIDGDADGFYGEIARVNDANRVCGFSPLYYMLRYLDSAEGVQVAYDHCPADAEDTSLVSICGLLLG